MHCLFCDSEKISRAAYPRPTHFNGKMFHYLECGSCGLVFIDPLPAADDYRKMYAETYHNQFYFKDAVPDYSHWLTLFEKFSGEKNILDYGCGDGGFLKFFQQNGYHCTGVEYDPELVERLRKENPGIDFLTVDQFWALGDASRFSVIYMGDVLEHISTPAGFLKQLMGKIKPGGLLAAQGPLENNSHLALSIRKLFSWMKKHLAFSSVADHVPYHIFFSNARNQKAVFEQAGLKSIHFEVTEENWPFPKKLSPNPFSGLKFLAAKTSRFFSENLSGQKGNRFSYIGQKK